MEFLASPLPNRSSKYMYSRVNRNVPLYNLLGFGQRSVMNFCCSSNAKMYKIISVYTTSKSFMQDKLSSDNIEKTALLHMLWTPT